MNAQGSTGPDPVTYDVVWTGAQETAAIRDRQRHAADQASPRRTPGSRAPLAQLVRRQLDSQYRTGAEIADQVGRSVADTISALYLLRRHGLVETESPPVQGRRMFPQRYRIRSAS